jgi:ribulose-5-phosphate 4-epimerase/fuculose-1-phosphate aldolase
MLITPAKDLADVSESEILEVPLDCSSLPKGAPSESWVHLAIYRLRPNAHSIARAQPTSALAAAANTATLVPLHGQAAWLGESIPVHDRAHLLRSADLAEGAAAALGTGEALLLRGNGALTIGSTPGIAAARMWLLSATCEVWIAARSAGEVNILTAEEIASWRAVSDELLPRLWHHLHRRFANRSRSGQEPPPGSLP